MKETLKNARAPVHSSFSRSIDKSLTSQNQTRVARIRDAIDHENKSSVSRGSLSRSRSSHAVGNRNSSATARADPSEIA